jgi:hypothetical protein
VPSWQAALPTAAQDHRPQLNSTPDIQRANAFRPAELVRRHCRQVDTQLVHRERDLARRLRRVRVEQRSGPARHCGQFGDGLDGAGLVVGVHNRYQKSVLGKSRGQIPRPHHPVPVHRQHCQPDTLCGKSFAGLQDRRVLGGLGDHLAHAPRQNAGDRQRVALAAAPVNTISSGSAPNNDAT